MGLGFGKDGACGVLSLNVTKQERQNNGRGQKEPLQNSHELKAEKKKSGWAAICGEFKANENLSTRTAQQHHQYSTCLVFIFGIAHVIPTDCRRSLN